MPVRAYICPELPTARCSETAARHLVTIGQTGMSEVAGVSPEVFAKNGLSRRQRRPAAGCRPVRRGWTTSGFAARPSWSSSRRRRSRAIWGGTAARPTPPVDVVIVLIPSDSRGTDLHNPNVIRASLGPITVPAVAAPSDEAIAHCAPTTSPSSPPRPRLRRLHCRRPGRPAGRAGVARRGARANWDWVSH